MALAAKNLTVAIGGKTILQQVGIEFRSGARTAIIGPNGAGKSTLLRVLAGLNVKYDGEILLDGRNLREISRKKIARKLAVLPQGLSAPADITVGALVDYGRFPYRSWHGGSNAREDREAVEWALAETKLKDFRERRVAELSGGERQRAWIAMALAQQPAYLLLDEPTTYLDIAHQLEVMQIIERLNREEGMTILMVLHDINHALQYADEIAVIKDRGIYAQGTPEKVVTVDLLADVFGVRADIFTNTRGAAVLSPVALLHGDAGHPE